MCVIALVRLSMGDVQYAPGLLPNPPFFLINFFILCQLRHVLKISPKKICQKEENTSYFKKVLFSLYCL